MNPSLNSSNISETSTGIIPHKLNSFQDLPVYYYVIPHAPILDIRLIFDAGSQRDTQNYGLAALTTQLLDQGTQHHSANRIAELFSEAGGEYNAHTHRDMTILSLRSLKKAPYFQKNLKTFLEILHEPLFTEEAIQKEKAKIQILIEESQESLENVAEDKMYEVLYGNTPYAHPVIGTSSSIERITRQNILEFFQTYFVAQGAKIVIVGDISLSEVENISKRISESLHQGKKPQIVEDILPPISSNFYVINRPTSQANLYLGQIGIPRNHPDLDALNVGNQILGGQTMTSRLFKKIREEQGLAYVIYSHFIPMSSDGPFLIFLKTREQESKKAAQLVKNTFEDFLKNGPTEEELINIKQYLIGSFPLHFISSQAIASQIAILAFYNLPLNYFSTYSERIGKLKTLDIKKAFQKHFMNKPLITVEVRSKDEKNKKTTL